MRFGFGDAKLTEEGDIKIVPNAWEPDLMKTWEKKLALSAWVVPTVVAAGAVAVVAFVLLRQSPRRVAVAGHRRRRTRRTRRNS